MVLRNAPFEFRFDVMRVDRYLDKGNYVRSKSHRGIGRENRQQSFSFVYLSMLLGYEHPKERVSKSGVLSKIPKAEEDHKTNAIARNSAGVTGKHKYYVLPE
jgi:hypothetical protein